MTDISALLKIDRDILHGLTLQAKVIVDLQIEKVINRNCRRLEQIAELALGDSTIKVSTKSIEDVIRKVRYYAKKEDADVEWNVRELRIVSYYMSQLQDDDSSFRYSIDLLEYNWRNLFFSGLVFSILNTWNHIKPEYRNKACDLLRKKLEEYDDNNFRYRALKNHADYFEDSGPLRLATLLSQQEIALENAPTILGYKPSTIAWSFYSDVIVSYISKTGIKEENIVEHILSLHGLERTKKMVFANLIIKEEQSGDAFSQNKLSRFATKMIGDVSISTTWAPFTGATTEEISKLRKAKDLVNLWYARIVIDVFFEICVQDYARKAFWLNYVDMVDDFRVAGSFIVMRQLESDPRINGMLSKYFISTTSFTSQTAALILCMKDKVFVEFSDTGALYVYEHNNAKLRSIESGRKYIDKVEDLKKTSLPLLVKPYSYNCYYYDYNPEGRMPHRGDWQFRLRRWIQRMVVDRDAPKMTFSTKADDRIFRNTSIEDVSTNQ